MSGAEVRFDDVRFSYAGDEEFHFDFAVGSGKVVAIMGASGSGKSTLLHLAAGFETPQSGRILIGGSNVTLLPPQARPVTMVFQDNNLFGHLDIAANVGLGLSPLLRLGADDRRRVAEALAATGLAGKERRLPRELSGGERQRVALARALVRDRPVLLMDEPFASLDEALRHEMQGLVRELHARLGMTILLVSHHPDDAERLADEVFVLEGRRIARRMPAAGPATTATRTGDTGGT